MATNPSVPQGTLNRLIGSVSWVNLPELNVTAPYLGRDGIRLSLEGESTAFLPTLTGAVTSREAYQMIGVTIHLLKPQGLADLYKQRLQSSALVGDGTIRPDTTTLGAFDVVNCAIQSVRELNFSGNDAEFAVAIRGYWYINNDLWDLLS